MFFVFVLFSFLFSFLHPALSTERERESKGGRESESNSNEQYESEKEQHNNVPGETKMFSTGGAQVVDLVCASVPSMLLVLLTSLNCCMSTLRLAHYALLLTPAC